MRAFSTPPVVGRTQNPVPGAFGCANWGSTAGDPATGMIYVRAWDGADTRVLEERQPASQGGSPGQARFTLGHAPLCHGPDRTNLPAPARAGIMTRSKAIVVAAARREMPPIAEKRAVSARSGHDYCLSSLIRRLAEPGEQLRRRSRGQPPRPARPRPVMAPPPPGQTRHFLSPWLEILSRFFASDGLLMRSLRHGPNLWPG